MSTVLIISLFCGTRSHCGELASMLTGGPVTPMLQSLFKRELIFMTDLCSQVDPLKIDGTKLWGR